MSRFSGLFNIQPPQYKPSDDGGYDSGMAGDMFSGAMNVLDLPGSMVRDAISFSNPFDQLVTPFSDKNRTTGAQISKYWAGGDEDSGGNQLAGLVIDVLTDPMMLATGGTAAVGRAGLAGGKAAMRGLKGVGKAASGAYDTAKATTPLSRINKMEGLLKSSEYGPNKKLLDSVSTKARADENLANALNRQQMNQGAYLGVVDRYPKVDNLDVLDTVSQAAGARVDDLANRLVNNQERLKNIRASAPLAIRAAEAVPYYSGARAGAQQLGQSAYRGARSAFGNAYDAGRGLLGRAVTGNRNAMLQSGAIGSNVAQTATGQRMSQEPTLEDMIAQALAEDPQLMEELLMAMGAGEAGY